MGVKEMAGFQAAHRLGTLCLQAHKPRGLITFCIQTEDRRRTWQGTFALTEALVWKWHESLPFTFHQPPVTAGEPECVSQSWRLGEIVSQHFTAYPPSGTTQGCLYLCYLFFLLSILNWDKMCTCNIAYSMEYPFHTMHFLFASSFILTILWCRY